jgi:ATP/maltotriose-dependent transcriptional regulator MalT/DNA-binding SARP family transcriptional activator
LARRQAALAKISRPRLHDVLARTRLLGLLDKALKRPIVWLSAQPGSGKTALVASLLEQRQRTGIWYQVDADDADPASFIYHLRLAAISSVPAGHADASDRLPLLTPEYMQDLAGFSRRFFRALYAGLDADAVLVLDNFQEAPEDAAFHRIIVEGLDEIPGDINVIVISRADPPAIYAPLLASDAIALIDGEQLRMTLPETRAIARKRGVTDEAAVAALHERSHGWAAGLTLLLTRTRHPSADAKEDDADSMQHVFGYFAQRVFDGAPAEQQRALLQLAFVPLITIPLARQLTGLDHVERLLDHYYKRHLFTDRRRVTAAPAHPGYVFQFHALFRTFLQHHARASWSAVEIRETAERAGRLLDAEGHWEQALPLLAEAGVWDAYAEVMAAHAEGLIDQGRRQTVVDWLQRMPQTERERNPWLGYWEGRALMVSAPDSALSILQTRYERFVASGDVSGQLACGAAIVQTLWDARLGWSEINLWVDRLESLVDANVRFPSPGMELLTRSALHAALVFCRLGHPAIPAMGLQMLHLVDDPGISWSQRLSTATHLIVYFHNAADHENATALIGKVDQVIGKRPSSALNRAFWLIFRAMHDLRQGDYDATAEGLQCAEDLGRQEGLGQVEYAAMQFRVYLDLLLRYADKAQARIARMEMHPARRNPDGAMHFHSAQCLLAQLNGDFPAALAHAERGLAIIERIGAQYFTAVFPVLLASAFADGGQPSRALEIIANARRIARGNYLEVMDAQLLLEEAYVALTQGDAATARSKLAEGFALVTDRRRAAYIHRIVARKPVLLVEALRAGIETEFVRRLIRRWRIPPPADEMAEWPWAIKVRTLGHFDVLVHDTPIEFGRKAPKKTLALLKAIIARGGSAPESALQDAFWPSEAGDAAARSLGAAVHRLRGLIGEGDAVIQQGGKLSLDRELVWVDAWAFERALNSARDSRSHDASALADALALYRGAFLVEEEGESWPVPMRERLRSKFVQAVADHAARLEAANRHEEAVAWYLQGLDADSVVEPFYQGLMRCYHRLDRLPEAVSAYRRLKQTLSVTLSLSPSAGTEKLYRSLRLDS